MLCAQAFNTPEFFGRKMIELDKCLIKTKFELNVLHFIIFKSQIFADLLKKASTKQFWYYLHCAYKVEVRCFNRGRILFGGLWSIA